MTNSKKSRKSAFNQSIRQAAAPYSLHVSHLATKRLLGAVGRAWTAIQFAEFTRRDSDERSIEIQEFRDQVSSTASNAVSLIGDWLEYSKFGLKVFSRITALEFAVASGDRTAEREWFLDASQSTGFEYASCHALAIGVATYAVTWTRGADYSRMTAVLQGLFGSGGIDELNIELTREFARAVANRRKSGFVCDLDQWKTPSRQEQIEIAELATGARQSPRFQPVQVIRNELSGSKLKLFDHLLHSDGWVYFSELKRIEGAFREGVNASDSAVKEQLRELQKTLNAKAEAGYELTIQKSSNRTKLVKPPEQWGPN